MPGPPGHASPPPGGSDPLPWRREDSPSSLSLSTGFAVLTGRQGSPRAGTVVWGTRGEPNFPQIPGPQPPAISQRKLRGVKNHVGRPYPPASQSPLTSPAGPATLGILPCQAGPAYQSPRPEPKGTRQANSPGLHRRAQEAPEPAPRCRPPNDPSQPWVSRTASGGQLSTRCWGSKK